MFLAPENPKYHAYYGKALSADDTQRHKAESEMQTAIKMDSTNPTFRLILAEFFIHMNMTKRAEGELNRCCEYSRAIAKPYPARQPAEEIVKLNAVVRALLRA